MIFFCVKILKGNPNLPARSLWFPKTWRVFPSSETSNITATYLKLYDIKRGLKFWHIFFFFFKSSFCSMIHYVLNSFWKKIKNYHVRCPLKLALGAAIDIVLICAFCIHYQLNRCVCDGEYWNIAAIQVKCLTEQMSL